MIWCLSSFLQKEETKCCLLVHADTHTHTHPEPLDFLTTVDFIVYNIGYLCPILILFYSHIHIICSYSSIVVVIGGFHVIFLCELLDTLNFPPKWGLMTFASNTPVWVPTRFVAESDSSRRFSDRRRCLPPTRHFNYPLSPFTTRCLTSNS